MKLLKIKNSVKTTVKPQNIKRKLQGVTSLGYIIIHSPKKVETTVKRGIASVRVFKTKAALKLAKIHLQLKTKANEIKSRLFNQCFVQSGILESAVSRAKQALKIAKTMMLSTQEYFVLHVNLCRAYLHLRNFKYALPRQIVNFLF